MFRRSRSEAGAGAQVWNKIYDTAVWRAGGLVVGGGALHHCKWFLRSVTFTHPGSELQSSVSTITVSTVNKIKQAGCRKGIEVAIADQISERQDG